MRRWTLLACLVAATMFPVAGASIVGTAENPELVDAPGDVRYDALYLGAHDNDYLDITKAWLAFDEEAAEVSLKIKVLDPTGHEFLDTGWGAACFAQGGVTIQDERVGLFEFYFRRAFNDTGFTTWVRFFPEVTGSEGAPIQHTFTPGQDADTAHEFRVELSRLRNFGEAIHDLFVMCFEYFPDQNIHPQYNEDQATSESVYSLMDLEAQDPAAPPPVRARPSPRVSPEDADATSVPAATLAVIALGVVAMSARRRPF